jgi:hypothetical protein
MVISSRTAAEDDHSSFQNDFEGTHFRSGSPAEGDHSSSPGDGGGGEEAGDGKKKPVRKATAKGKGLKSSASQEFDGGKKSSKPKKKLGRKNSVRRIVYSIL